MADPINGAPAAEEELVDYEEEEAPEGEAAKGDQVRPAMVGNQSQKHLFGFCCGICDANHLASISMTHTHVSPSHFSIRRSRRAMWAFTRLDSKTFC